MGDIVEGRALLENFRRRQRLRLLPGGLHPGHAAGTVSVERLEALLNHQAFGYSSDWKGRELCSVDSPSAADPLRGGENSRRAALQAQLEELEKARAEEDAKEQALQQAAHTLQQEGGEMDCQLVGWLVG